MNKPGVSTLALMIAFALTAATAATAAESSPEGFWMGGIRMSPQRQLEVMVEIERRGAAWNVSVYVPSQHIRDVDTINVTIEGAAASFEIPGPPGEPTFQGVLSEDGQTISGDYSQGGQVFPFSLARSPKPEELKTDIYAEYRQAGASGKGLAGRWRGLLEFPPHRMRLLLTVSRDAEGKLTGTVESVDQGAQGLPIDSLEVSERTVQFRLTPINAEYEGRMSEDGSEIAGEWRQGDPVALIFRRVAD